MLCVICGDWSAVSGMASHGPSLQPLVVVNEDEWERHVWLESSWQSVWHHSLVGRWSAEARLVTDGALLSYCQLLSTPRWMLCTNLRWLGHRRPKRHYSCQKLRTESKLQLGFTVLLVGSGPRSSLFSDADPFCFVTHTQSFLLAYHNIP